VLHFPSLGAPPAGPPPRRNFLNDLKMPSSPECETDPRRGNARIGPGIILGGPAGLLLGGAGAALSGQVRWVGVGLVLGATGGLVVGSAGARRLRNQKGTR
jgi:hypothetical protein